MYAINRDSGNSERLTSRNADDTSEQDGVRCSKIEPE